jgi:hypothetical protein
VFGGPGKLLGLMTNGETGQQKLREIIGTKGKLPRTVTIWDGDRETRLFRFHGNLQNALAELLLIPSGPEEQVAPDLALLVSPVADKSLTPQTGPERKARHCAGCRRTA